MSLSPDIFAIPGFGVRLSPDRVVVGADAGGDDRKDIRENVANARDIFNGPVSVANANTVLVRVPSGARYHVRIFNNGTGNIHVAIGVPATTIMFPLAPGDIWENRIAGELDVTAIADAASEPCFLWISTLS